MERGFSANLDLLRSIAVLLVLAQHLCKRLQMESTFPTSFASGSPSACLRPTLSGSGYRYWSEHSSCSPCYFITRSKGQ